MSEIHQHLEDPSYDDATRFDRLADGETSAEEYRSILAGLDDEPGGWRRCAMAFLEAQALKNDLGELRDRAVSSHAKEKPESPVATQAIQWPVLLAIAASFLAAFGLGYALRSPWPTTRQSDGPVAEENRNSPHDNRQHSQDSALAGNSPANRVKAPLREEDVAETPLQNVTLVVGDDADHAEQFEIPVVYYGDVGDEYFRSQHSAMPPEIREMIERQGHQLRRTQGYVPVTMEDGQQLVVPVEEVEIVPVSWPAF